MLYKNRWQVELFFKWMKQHLRIKEFYGTSENAVKIQLYTALTAYCLVALVKKTLSIQKDIYEMLRVLTVSLFVKTDLKVLFEKQETKPSLQNVTELNLIFKWTLVMPSSVCPNGIFGVNEICY